MELEPLIIVPIVSGLLLTLADGISSGIYLFLIEVDSKFYCPDLPEVD